jgi:hypothetical protein
MLTTSVDRFFLESLRPPIGSEGHVEAASSLLRGMWNGALAVTTHALQSGLCCFQIPFSPRPCMAHSLMHGSRCIDKLTTHEDDDRGRQDWNYRDFQQKPALVPKLWVGVIELSSNVLDMFCIKYTEHMLKLVMLAAPQHENEMGRVYRVIQNSVGLPVAVVNPMGFYSIKRTVLYSESPCIYMDCWIVWA